MKKVLHQKSEDAEDFGSMIKPALVGAILAIIAALILEHLEVKQLGPVAEVVFRGVAGYADFFGEAYAALRNKHNKRLGNYVKSQIIGMIVGPLIVIALNLLGKKGIIPYDQHGPTGAIGAAILAHSDNWAGYIGDLVRCVKRKGTKEGFRSWLRTPYVIGGVFGSLSCDVIAFGVRFGLGGIYRPLAIAIEASALGPSDTFSSAIIQAIFGKRSKKVTQKA